MTEEKARAMVTVAKGTPGVRSVEAKQEREAEHTSWEGYAVHIIDADGVLYRVKTVQDFVIALDNAMSVAP